MNFIYGILVIIIIIFIIINFASVNVYDSNPNVQNFIRNSNSNNNSNSNSNKTSNTYRPPAALVSGAPSAINNKFNLEEQTYDYNKYFFI